MLHGFGTFLGKYPGQTREGLSLVERAYRGIESVRGVERKAAHYLRTMAEMQLALGDLEATEALAR